MYRCRKVKCDFFDRYPDRFSRCFAIERSARPTNVIDWPAVRDAFAVRPTKIGEAVVNHYFELASRELQKKFRNEFKIVQEVVVAAGAPYIDVDAPALWSGASFACVFQNIGIVALLRRPRFTKTTDGKMNPFSTT
jgi:hypothetical protein